MKKYFLLGIVLMVMFLWLGSYTTWQIPSNPPSIVNTPNTSPWDLTNTLINTQSDKQWVTNALQNTPNNSNASASSSDVWSMCELPKWSKRNAFLKCVCDPWFKNVNDVCTSCSADGVCCGISLNTSVPFIGNCIESNTDYKSVGETGVTWEQAFPVLMWSLTKMLVTVILIVSFLLILIGGIMIATGNRKWGMDMIKKVAIGIALLWASGVILRLINPNFFG